MSVTYLLGAHPGLAVDGIALAHHEKVLLALFLQVRESTGMGVAFELFPSANDALQPVQITPKWKKMSSSLILRPLKEAQRCRVLLS